jgi:hypothetical protein
MHLTETQINDFVDDTLDAGERDVVSEHVRACAECRAEVEALQTMLQKVGGLPLSIAPARDLRPQVWAQADRKTLWHWRYPLAAAAIALIAISSIMTLLISRDQNEELPTAAAPAPNSVDLVSLERQYSTELEELQRALRNNRDELAPETVQILEENLGIIDKAIQEARDALTRDPNSSTLGELLRSAYQRKLDLLKQAARTSAVT